MASLRERSFILFVTVHKPSLKDACVSFVADEQKSQDFVAVDAQTRLDPCISEWIADAYAYRLAACGQ